jgi:DnaJ-class molecular chaperone
MMKILCSSCEGKGYVDPPYGTADTVAAITCPCCGGSGVQAVEVREE